MDLLMISLVAVTAIVSLSVLTFKVIKIIILDDINLARKLNLD